MVYDWSLIYHYTLPQTAKGKGKGKAPAKGKAAKGSAGGRKKSTLGLQVGEPAPDFALKDEVCTC